MSLRLRCPRLIAGTLLLSDILADLSGKPLEDTAIKSLISFYSARLVSSDSCCLLLFSAVKYVLSLESGFFMNQLFLILHEINVVSCSFRGPSPVLVELGDLGEFERWWKQ